MDSLEFHRLNLDGIPTLHISYKPIECKNHLFIKIFPKIMPYLSYHEATCLRRISKGIKRIVDEHLFTEFVQLGLRLQNAIKELRNLATTSKNLQNVILAVYLAQVEYRILRNELSNYLETGKLPFFGGKLLDIFRLILGKARSFSKSSTSEGIMFNIDELSFQVEKFLSYLENILEEWEECFRVALGVRLTNILDSLFGSKALLHITYNNSACRIDAMYECPLGGIANPRIDVSPVERIGLVPTKVNSQLQSLRELVRRSNRSFVKKYLDYIFMTDRNIRKYLLPDSFFLGRYQNGGKILNKSSKLVTERWKRILIPSPSSKFGKMYLKVNVTACFPLWQCPIDFPDRGNNFQCFPSLSDTEFEDEDFLEEIEDAENLYSRSYPGNIECAILPSQKVFEFELQLRSNANYNVLGKMSKWLTFSFVPIRFIAAGRNKKCYNIRNLHLWRSEKDELIHSVVGCTQ